MEHTTQSTKVCLSIPEVAESLGISVLKAYDLASQQDFPVIRICKRKVVPVKQFTAWLEAQCSNREASTAI